MSARVRLCKVLVSALGFAGCGSVQARPGDDAGNTGGNDGGGIDAGVDGPIIDGPIIDGPPGQPPPPASCVGLAATCGINRNDSCCNSLQVYGGNFFRDFDNSVSPDSGNRNFPAALSDFRLDKYEVTVGRFRKFVNAGMGIQANPPPPSSGAHATLVGSGWDSSFNASLSASSTALRAALACDPTFQTWTDQADANENRPINCLTWFEAMAFCIWDGGYLPTEAEWNYAATGGALQRAYPWSVPVDIDGQRASYSPDGVRCIGDGQPDCAVTDLLNVGSLPAGDGRWGHSDLSGNVSEWTLDWKGDYVLPCTDCANLVQTTQHRVIRGGGYNDGPKVLRTNNRGPLTPATTSGEGGVRCARPVLPATTAVR